MALGKARVAAAAPQRSAWDDFAPDERLPELPCGRYRVRFEAFTVNDAGDIPGVVHVTAVEQSDSAVGVDTIARIWLKTARDRYGINAKTMLNLLYSLSGATKEELRGLMPEADIFDSAFFAALCGEKNEHADVAAEVLAREVELIVSNGKERDKAPGEFFRNYAFRVVEG